MRVLFVFSLVALLAVVTTGVEVPGAVAEEDAPGVDDAKPLDFAALARALLGDDQAAARRATKATAAMTKKQLQRLIQVMRAAMHVGRQRGRALAVAKQDKPVVTIDAKVIEMERRALDDLPIERDPRQPVTYLDDTAAEVILRALEKSSKVTVLGAPRLSAFDRQQANVSVVNQTSYVQDYDIEKSEDGLIADPVVGIVQEGLTLDLKPILSSDHTVITVELEGTWSKLARPIQELEIDVGPTGQPTAKVKVQLPQVSVSRMAATATLPTGTWALVGGGPLVERDGAVYRRLVLLRASTTTPVAPK